MVVMQEVLRSLPNIPPVYVPTELVTAPEFTTFVIVRLLALQPTIPPELNPPVTVPVFVQLVIEDVS